MIEFKDYRGSACKNGDLLAHPSGQRFRLTVLNGGEDYDDFKADYMDGSTLSNAWLQVGRKGQAVKEAKAVRPA